MSKNDLIKTFNMDKNTFKKLSRYADERSISKSAVLRILINEHCSKIDIRK
jgi:hypothetical protein